MIQMFDLNHYTSYLHTRKNNQKKIYSEFYKVENFEVEWKENDELMKKEFNTLKDAEEFITEELL